MRYVNLPSVADVHVLQRCSEAFHHAAHGERARFHRAEVVFALPRLVEDVAFGVACRRQQSAAVVHLHRVGVERTARTRAGVEHVGEHVVVAVCSQLVVEAPRAQHLPVGSAAIDELLHLGVLLVVVSLVGLLPVGELFHLVVGLFARRQACCEDCRHGEEYE